MPADESPVHSRSRPAPLACYSCRSKHLKCDGASPVCSRCSSVGAVCTYVPSRRGRSARIRKSYPSNLARQVTPLPIEATSEETLVLDNSGAASASSAAETCNPFTPAETSHLISLYYSRFHRSHPMLVPQVHFSAQQYPDYLVLAVCLVGHHFASSRPSPSLIRTAASLAESSRGADHVHHQVQTLILCALVISSASKQSSLADNYITKAAQLACASNLHCVETNVTHEAARSIEQESLRRTWWELYIVDAVLALLRHRCPSFPSSSLSSSQPFMPCSELHYETGKLSSDNLAHADFENRILMQTPPEFSSYAYRIHAAVIIRRVCPLLMGGDLDPHELEAADQAIAAWNLDSPKASFISCDSNGEVDHMLLQAHLLVQVATLFLHVPRTNLPLFAPRAMDVTCLGGGNQGTETCGLHIIKSVAASKEICNLATIPWLQESHTPLLLCGFVLGCAVQLAVASSRSGMISPKQTQQCRQRVVLMLSALKFLGGTWPLAQDALLRFQPIAHAVFSPLAARGHDEPDGPTDSCITVEGGASEIGQDGRADSAQNVGALGEDYSCNIDWFDFFASVDVDDSLLQRTSVS